jgi:hypothetical protein
MQLAPMRFARIEGTAVSVTVVSAEEAKAALDELRQKKRELKFLRGALAKKRKAAGPKRTRKTRAKAPRSGVAMFLDDMRWGLSALIDQPGSPGQPGKPPTAAEIAAEIARLDETLHNIEGCILQLQGKLLTHGRSGRARR